MHPLFSQLDQIAFIASQRSRISLKRLPHWPPWFSNSSRFQPPPTPKSTRPPEIWSMLATSLAVMIGSRSTTRQMPVPSRIRLVTAAAAARQMNMSTL